MPEPLFLETVKIEDGQIFNLSFHQARFVKTQKAFFGIKHNLLRLSDVINAPKKGLYRCRILYDERIQTVEYIPYAGKEIHTLKIVSSNLDYTYKYANRESLSALLETNPDADEVIIEKDGFLTDTTMANIAFYDGNKWCTPLNPLLQGTTMTRLLDQGFLHSKEITKKTLSDYTHVALMNAMIGFKIIKKINIFS
jgi:4-amino-4-deoxychorismate lyase